jgi:hypothetical protein
MKNLLWLAVAAALLIGAYVLMQNRDDMRAEDTGPGTYAYSCANGSTFSMTPAEDMQSVKLFAGSQGMFTGEITLSAVPSATNARFEGTYMGNAVIFTGAGEEVAFAIGTQTTFCNPVPNAEMAPWNWGDLGEGGGSEQPDAALVVKESIVGKWESTGDVKFVRELRADGTFTDSYDGASTDDGTWKVFSGANAPAVSFSVEANAVYLQLVTEHDVVDTLSFKISKLTPEELEMIYLERGGVLSFRSIQ